MLRFRVPFITAVLALTATALAGCAADIQDPSDVGSTAEPLKCGLDIPADIAAPAGNKLAFTFYAEGVQIYDCKPGANGALGWVFRAPEADLFGKHHRLAGSHYAGPTWEALDGSTVVGARVNGVTVDPTAIPWLLLSATPKTTSGLMSKVTFIQRLETVGGLMPAGACEAGAVAEVEYTATYAFYEAHHGRH
jgi:Protein of unknown function (DUF3455)